MSDAKMDRDENNVRLFSWGFQSLVSCLWGAVILSPLTHNTGHWRVLEVFAVAVLITLCDICVNKLSIQYKSLAETYETLKYGIMFGLSPPNPETILDNIEKAESPVNFKQSVFMVCDVIILTLKWKMEKLKKFIIEQKKGLDILCMCVHYSLLLWLGILDWIFISFLGSIQIFSYLLNIPVPIAVAPGARDNDRMRGE